MRILFITSNRLGDAVLSTGLLDHLIRIYPDARVTVACGVLPSGLFEGMPNLEKIIVLKKQSWNRHWIELWKQVSPRIWDIVVDLRDSAVSRLLLARRRYIHSARIDKTIHKVEQNASVMGLSPAPSPVIWQSPEQERMARQIIPDNGRVLGVGPTSNWIGKTWPEVRFIALIERLTAPSGILPGARVAVFGAPGEEDAAYTVLNSIPEDRRINIIARTDPGTVAVCLKRCDLYIGNDSGLMHCAAAAGTPTVGLFGPGWPNIYRPWGENTAYVRTPETHAELTSFPGYNPKTLTRSLMTTLDAGTVGDMVEAFWKRL